LRYATIDWHDPCRGEAESQPKAAGGIAMANRKARARPVVDALCVAVCLTVVAPSEAQRAREGSRASTAMPTATNAATHLVGDIRPQEVARHIDTPPLRGIAQQRLFGSQRALRTVEDFTERFAARRGAVVR
jgi:hypothetical protein